MKLKEIRIIDELVGYCYNKGLYFKREVPLFASRIDLVMVNPKNNEVVAIEAKISNWYRALQQATSYTMCADKVYLALWDKYVHRANKEFLDRYGIGLLSVNGTVDIYHPARKSSANRELVNGIRNSVLNNN